MTLAHPGRRTLAVLAAAVLAAPAFADRAGRDGGPHAPFNRLPAFVHGDVRVTELDGNADDLLTAGLGRSGLALPLPPFANAVLPTAAELRRAALYNSYRAIVDMTAVGGYGTLYGPNVAVDGTPTAGEGKIAGTEYLAFSRGADGLATPQNVVLLVQVPASFDPRRPCIVTATSSGSRGIYGAISTGEWGLKRGCAVAYTDKGTGSGPHDLMADTVPLIDGTRTTATLATASRSSAPPCPTSSAPPSTPPGRTASPSSTRIRCATRRRTGAASRCRRWSSRSGRSTTATASRWRTGARCAPSGPRTRW